MKAKEIADRLTHTDFDVSELRLRKMAALAARSGVSVREVLDAVSEARQDEIKTLAANVLP